LLIKKPNVIGFVLVLCLFAGSIVAVAQSKKNGESYDPPDRLALTGRGEPDDEDSNKPPHETWIAEKFFPIGWSKDGKFAYYVEPADEACGCYFAKLVIQDLKTDKILWEHDYTGEESSDETETIKTHWQKNRRLFSRQLTKYGIVAGEKFSLMTSSVDYENDSLTPKLELNFDPDNESGTEIDGEFYYGVEGSLILRLVSKEKGEKVIYRRNYHPKDGNLYRGAELTGFLKSPYEPRIAVILIEIIRGYEGPPHITKIRIVGADLTSRFEK